MVSWKTRAISQAHCVSQKYTFCGCTMQFQKPLRHHLLAWCCLGVIHKPRGQLRGEERVSQMIHFITEVLFSKMGRRGQKYPKLWPHGLWMTPWSKVSLYNARVDYRVFLDPVQSTEGYYIIPHILPIPLNSLNSTRNPSLIFKTTWRKKSNLISQPENSDHKPRQKLLTEKRTSRKKYVVS